MNKMPHREVVLVVEVSSGQVRIDQYLAGVEELALTRSHAQKLLKDGLVKVNGQITKASYKVRAGDRVEVKLPEAEPLSVRPQEIPLDIVFEDQDVIVVNKPRGMVVHPAAGNYEGTLVNALLHHCQDLQGINDVLRPGIVHRLDKDTTGLLVVAKNESAYLSLSRQIKERQVKRGYLALVYGVPSVDHGKIDAPIGRHPVDRKKMAVVAQGGREAITHFEVKERFSHYSLLYVRLETGRTHQIRVHLAYIGHPVVGDQVYTRRKDPFGLGRQALHAFELRFIHPRTGAWMEFTAPLPADMARALELLRGL